MVVVEWYWIILYLGIVYDFVYIGVMGFLGRLVYSGENYGFVIGVLNCLGK